MDSVFPADTAPVPPTAKDLLNGSTLDKHLTRTTAADWLTPCLDAEMRVKPHIIQLIKCHVNIANTVSAAASIYSFTFTSTTLLTLKLHIF